MKRRALISNNLVTEITIPIMIIVILFTLDEIVVIIMVIAWVPWSSVVRDLFPLVAWCYPLTKQSTFDFPDLVCVLNWLKFWLFEYIISCFFFFKGFAYVPRDELVSLVSNEFRMQLSRALAVSTHCQQHWSIIFFYRIPYCSLLPNSSISKLVMITLL